MDDELHCKLDPRMASFMKGGKMIVEAGCGAGYTLDVLSPLYDCAIGIDVSDVPCNKGTNPPYKWRFIKSDLNEPFPLDRDCADVVLANQVIEHILDPFFFAREILRVLCPGGLAVVTTPNIRYVKHLWGLAVRGVGPQTANGNKRDGPWDDGHIHYFTHKDLRTTFYEAGYSKVMSRALIDLKGGKWQREILDRFSEMYIVREFLSGNLLLVATK